MKNRTLLGALEKKADSPLNRIIAVTGARQTGKTTLVKKAAKGYSYISMDDPTVRPQYARMSAAELYRLHPRAVVDEVQKLPAFVESIKAVHDQYANARYVLTGSSQILLLEKVRESLAGRVELLELYPLTLPELLTKSWSMPVAESRLVQWLRNTGVAPGEVFLGIPQEESGWAESKAAFEMYCELGGMPVLSQKGIGEEDKRQWLTDYIRTYLQRDVRDLANIRDLEPFTLAQQAAAQHTGCLVNFSDLGRLAAISSVTAKRFVSYLELSYQVMLLRPWFRNPNKRLVKAPKLHFVDPGIQRALVRRTGELTGREFESAVVAEIVKQVRNARINAQFHHLHTADGKEIDLLLELPDCYVAIEIKMAHRVSTADARHFRGLDGILDKPLAVGLVVSRDPAIQPLDGNAYAVPAAWLLSGQL